VRALALRRELRDADLRNALAANDLVSALTRLGAAESEIGDHAKALAHLSEALALLEKDDRASQQAPALTALARAHDRAGRSTEALRVWRLGLTARRAQVTGAKGPYQWLSQVDFARETRDFGRFLEAQAAAGPAGAAGEYRRESRAAYAEGLEWATRLQKEGHLMGSSTALPEEIRQGLERTSREGR
jgi:tetratricopeptide (TPR) repeat protein